MIRRPPDTPRPLIATQPFFDACMSKLCWVAVPGITSMVALDRVVAEALDEDRVLARLQVAGERRPADGADLLAVDEHVGARNVRRDLDPAEVVLLGQRDVDVDQLVGARG